MSLVKRWEDQTVREATGDTISGMDYLDKLLGLDSESRAQMVRLFKAGQTISQIAKAMNSIDEVVEEGLTMEGIALSDPTAS